MLRHPEWLLPCQIVTGLSKYIVTDPNKYKIHLGGFLLYPICGSRSPGCRSFETGSKHQCKQWQKLLEYAINTTTVCQRLNASNLLLVDQISDIHFLTKSSPVGFEVIKTRVRDYGITLPSTFFYQYLIGWEGHQQVWLRPGELHAKCCVRVQDRLRRICIMVGEDISATSRCD